MGLVAVREVRAIRNRHDVEASEVLGGRANDAAVFSIVNVKFFVVEIVRWRQGLLVAVG